MLISYKWLQTYFDKELPSPEKLALLFTTHVFEVEAMEEKNGDHIFDVKILPDRAHYLLSHFGVALEVSAICSLPIKLSDRKEIKITEEIGAPVVRVKNPKLCRRYMMRRVENISLKNPPDWLQTRLSAIGQRSINSLVDLANYVMFDIGQPTHIFDADKVSGEIIVRMAEEGEKTTLLTGEEVSLKAQDLVIADNSGILGIAGVKGGKRAEVTKETKNIIIESANFDPVSIRHTSTRLNLRTDASKRFENEITPVRAEKGINEICRLISEIHSEARFGKVGDYYPALVSHWEIDFSVSQLSVILGVPLKEDEVLGMLESIGVKIEKTREGKFRAIPPFDRLDLKIGEDLADEIGRLKGYDVLDSVLPPNLENNVKLDKEFFVTEKIKNFLTEKGYSETLLYTLVPKGEWKIIHPLSSDKSALRENLCGKLEEALALNLRNSDLLELDRVKIFEVGHIFSSSGEDCHLALAVSSGRKNEEKAEEIIKKDFESLANYLKVSFSLNITTNPMSSIAEASLKEIIEESGEVINIGELNLASLSREKKYIPFSVYPYITRDIALFVPKDTDKEEVMKVIKENAGNLLARARLFDVYAKEGRTSLAYRLVFQSMERTLTDNEINESMKNLYSALSSKNGWEARE